MWLCQRTGRMLAYLIRLYGFRRELYVEPVIFLNNILILLCRRCYFYKVSTCCANCFLFVYSLFREKPGYLLAVVCKNFLSWGSCDHDPLAHLLSIVLSLLRYYTTTPLYHSTSFLFIKSIVTTSAVNSFVAFRSRPMVRPFRSHNVTTPKTRTLKTLTTLQHPLEYSE